MNTQSIIIGYFCRNAISCSKDSLLQELSQDNFPLLINEIRPWNDNIEGYHSYKTTSLPLLFFTLNPLRPSKDNNIVGSGYGCIDIDDGGHYESEHPVVVNCNQTPHGTHLFIYHKDLETNDPSKWQEAYNSLAYEVWCDLVEKYKKDIKFDGHLSSPYQGIFLWNTEWKRNESFNREYIREERFLSSTILEELYKSDTYSVIKGQLSSYRQSLENRFEVEEEMRESFWVLSYEEFLRKYELKYRPTLGTDIKYSLYTDYKGNTYEMHKTNGETTTLWNPTMRGVWKKGSSCLIEKGSRRKKLFFHLIQVMQFSLPSPSQLLYDAVYWMWSWNEDGDRFPKIELMNQTRMAFLKAPLYDNTLKMDRRRFITGEEVFFSDDSWKYMSKGEKISANASCRKTERLLKVLDMYNPSKTLEENLEEIVSWEDDIIGTLTLKKLEDYLLKASQIEHLEQIPDFKDRYEWLDRVANDIRKKNEQNKQEGRIKGGKKGGKIGSPKKTIAIKDKQSEKNYHFKSKTECMKWLECSSRTFTQFLKGSSKLNHRYEVI